MSHVNKQFRYYQLTLIFSILFSLIGFSYNVWRMEASEQNNTIRTASFEILVKLSSLEELIYTGHYDGDLVQASPRKGWVIVGLVNDLSVLVAPSVKASTKELVMVWSKNWGSIGNNEAAITEITTAIDATRSEIKAVLQSLQ